MTENDRITHLRALFLHLVSAGGAYAAAAHAVLHEILDTLEVDYDCEDEDGGGIPPIPVLTH